jgi:PKD repeat protein
MHAYDDGGTYMVKLTAVSDGGDTASKSVSVTVQP